MISLINTLIMIVGFVVFFTNHKSITNRSFLFFALTTSVWGFFNFFVSNIFDKVTVLWLARGVMFLAVWQAFSFFQLFYVFPNEKIVNKNKVYNFILLLIVIIVSLLTLSPLVFSDVIEINLGK